MSLFPPPTDIETEVWSELPDEFRKTGDAMQTVWGEGNALGARMDSFLEGPSFDRQGNLWVVDIPFGRVFRISPDKVWTLAAEYDGEPNGLKIRNDGEIFIADYKRGIMHLDPATGEVTEHRTRIRLEPFKGCNDLVFGSNGDMYFTDQGQTGWHDPTGRVFRLTPEGRLDLLVDTVPSPNGLVLNLDESILFLAVTRANQVWRVPLPPEGPTYKVGTFLHLSGGGGGPDGMALDEAGSLLVCHAGMGSVWVFDRMGEPLYRIRSCRGINTTNIAYGGPDNTGLFITESESGSILRAELPTPGRVMYSHMD
ncbi:MAG: SMP-30/gluconolactonase/LRE family protein [Alphaproteobacteria bacterium]|jgi:gluconolactonase|nr:SMP-30/gluconolactonase/LRE family protein [Alphaproteobacteria bacterium]